MFLGLSIKEWLSQFIKMREFWYLHAVPLYFDFCIATALIEQWEGKQTIRIFSGIYVWCEDSPFFWRNNFNQKWIIILVFRIYKYCSFLFGNSNFLINKCAFDGLAHLDHTLRLKMRATKSRGRTSNVLILYFLYANPSYISPFAFYVYMLFKL